MAGLASILALLSTVGVIETKVENGDYARDAVTEKKDDIVELNVEQLNDRGVNRLGVSINTYRPYTPYTVRLKSEKGQPTDRVTLRDTGDFHRSFELIPEPTIFYISATDGKTPELVDKYGSDIFGLTPDNMGKTSVMIYPLVMEAIKKELKNG